jgi:hypothetical protein
VEYPLQGRFGHLFFVFLQELFKVVHTPVLLFRHFHL